MTRLFASLVYGSNPGRSVARASMSGGREIRRGAVDPSTPTSTLVAAPAITGRPARPTSFSPRVAFVRPGSGSLTWAPADPHFPGSTWTATSCLCLCHYGDATCSPLPGTTHSYTDCSSVRR